MNTKTTLLGEDAIQAGIKAGNINTAGVHATYSMDLSAESQEAQEQHAETLRRYEAQQRARSIIVPTAVEDVQQKLRELGHVVTFFGENHANRRERLREVVARLELDEEESAEMQVTQKKKQLLTMYSRFCGLLFLFYIKESDELNIFSRIPT
jgi:U4/U6 small nuclear ribonucleoprotein PRP4